MFFTAIQSFEIALRSKLIHHFSMVYGAFWIMDRSLFADKKIFTDCSIRIQQEVFRSKEDFIQEHFDKYANPIMPLSGRCWKWSLVYAQLCCLGYLQNATHPDNDFKQQLKALLKAHPNVDVKAMGFPASWENESLWK